MNKKEETIARIADYNPEIIAITETKPKTSNYTVTEAELKIPNYTCHPGRCAEGRGVALYFKENMDVNINEDLTTNQADTVWCELKLNAADKLLVGCLYRSPNATPEQNTTVNSQILQASRMNFSHIIAVGDLNHPEIGWPGPKCNCKETHPAAVFTNIVRETFMTQHVDQPTHYRGSQAANTLDLILTDDEDLVDNIEYEAPIGKSHHSVLRFDINCQNDNSIPPRETYLYNKGDYHSIKNHLSTVDWDHELGNKTTEECWQSLLDTLITLKKRYIPRRMVRGNPKFKKKPVWMNPNALTKIKKKHAAWKRYLATRDGKEYTEYCQARNQARWATRKAMKEFERGIAKNAKSDPGSFYKYVRTKSSTRTGIGDLEANGTTAQTDKEKADVLNGFFTSVFTQEDTACPDFPDRHFQSPLLTTNFSPEKIKKKLLKLNPAKSPDPDGLHPKLLREAADELVYPLSILFKTSLEEGTVPASWRDGCITPIFKKGSKKDPGNYRPVSLTSLVCKLMEGLIKDSMMEHLMTNNLIASEQHGFVKGRSCSTQLLESMELWTQILDSHGCADTVYFDFQKAFDTVPHLRLLRKLEAYGFRGNLLKWIQAFLSGRRQQVSVNGTKSGWEEVVSGVPQGSVLGPTLFVIYINDLPEHVHSHIKLFADDTKLFREVSTVEDCKLIQEDIRSMEAWADKWLLRFHPMKCKVLRLGRKPPEFNYTMCGPNDDYITLAETESEKDLGVHIDNRLNFKTHIEETVNKANRIVGLIRRSFLCLDTQSFPLLFRALVRPHLEYGNVVWSPRLVGDQKLLEGVQRRATRLVPGLKDLPYEERLQRLNLPSLSHRRNRGDMIEVYKYVSNLYDVNTSWLKPKSFKTTRGHSLQLEKQRSTMELRRHSFSHRVVDNWNALPDHIVHAPSINSFKNRLDKEWSAMKYQF
jgi:hypothetical protein